MIPEIIDSHVRVSDPVRLTYPWLAERAFPQPCDAVRCAAEAPAFTGAVMAEAGTQANDDGQEAACRSQAIARCWILGMVAHARVEQPADLASSLAAYRGNPMVVGMRRNLQDERHGFLHEPGLGAGGRLVRGHGRTCAALRADLADRAAVTSLAAQLASWPRAVDILVNNAGTIARSPAAQHSDSDWDRVLQFDLTSQFILAREVGRTMIERGHGKIIFTASLLSFQGGIHVPATPPPSPASPASPALSPTSGHPAASTSTQSCRGMSPPTTPKHSETTRLAAPPSSTAFPPDDGPNRTTSPALPSSWHPAPRTTCTGLCCPSMAAGLAADTYQADG